jgi:hypothetical protein
LDAIEDQVKDSENTYRAILDPNLSPDERLDLLKNLQAWPRIVLGLYNAELAIAQKRKKDNPAQEHGEPSDIAYDEVADALCLSAERIRQLCKEGRRHRRQGMPPKNEISVADFVDKTLRGRVSPQKRKRRPQKRQSR